MSDMNPQPKPETQGPTDGTSGIERPAASVVGTPTATPPVASSTEARAAIDRVQTEVGKVIVGQDGVVAGVLTALLVEGHVLLEGVPGVAKSLLVTTLAAALDLETRRIQFTPDLMPSDITGQLVLGRDGGFDYREGPVFTNLLLADELNRTPPKTQSALLEAMQERQVSTAGVTRELPAPFIVVATQNPIEYEGTYPLPEAQLDRFLFQLIVEYPDAAEELEILSRHHFEADAGDPTAMGVEAVAKASDLLAARAEVHDIKVDSRVLQYIVDLAIATRTHGAIELGVSPRGSTMLLHASKAWAWWTGRNYVTPDEVQAMARPVLRHRLRLRPDVLLDGGTPDGVLDSLLHDVPVPR